MNQKSRGEGQQRREGGEGRREEEKGYSDHFIWFILYNPGGGFTLRSRVTWTLSEVTELKSSREQSQILAFQPEARTLDLILRHLLLGGCLLLCFSRTGSKYFCFVSFSSTCQYLALGM